VLLFCSFVEGSRCSQPERSKGGPKKHNKEQGTRAAQKSIGRVLSKPPELNYREQTPADVPLELNIVWSGRRV
jgi:hypothetical protein